MWTGLLATTVAVKTATSRLCKKIADIGDYYYSRRKRRILTTDDRPTSGPIHTFWKISNGHISNVLSIDGSGWGFRDADRTASFPTGSIPRKRLYGAILKI